MGIPLTDNQNKECTLCSAGPIPRCNVLSMEQLSSGAHLINVSVRATEGQVAKVQLRGYVSK